MSDAWNCQTHYASAHPEIGSENLVTVEREIVFQTESRLTIEIKRQNRVIVDPWNR